jgi:predicted CXXCH cytochrome family protein
LASGRAGGDGSPPSPCLWLAAALAILVAPRLVRADTNYHTSDTAPCTDCHTMHDSQQHGWDSSAPVSTTPTSDGNWLGGGGPNGYLLKLPADQLCITCHDALGLPAATDTTTAPATSATTTSAAGTFAVARVVGLKGGHSLGAAVPTAAVQRGPATHPLGCATCHSPHGSTSFRNLRVDPTGKGEKHPVVAHVASEGKGDRYAGDNIVYQGGMSDWCRSCHAEVHEHGRDGTAPGRPDDATLGASPSVNVAAWMKPMDGRVRVERPGGGDRPSASDRVMCLTCHRAHGSANRASLVYSDGTTITSTCQQCHDE